MNIEVPRPPENVSNLRWPLTHMGVLSEPGSPGAFGAVRKHDVHTGIDIHCSATTVALAAERGAVVAVLQFTGEAVGSPWWNDTWAVLVEGDEHVICYGEVRALVSVGTTVAPGDPIGGILPVLKKTDRCTTMLHFEMYVKGTREPVWWRLGEAQPACLLDPTAYLTLLSRSHL